MTNSSPLSVPHWPLPHCVIVIPVNRDGRPRIDGRAIGTAIDCGPDDVTLELHAPSVRLTGDLVLGVDDPEGGIAYRGAQVVAATEAAPGMLRVSCRFGGLGEELLDPRHLVARFDAVGKRHVLGFPADVLAAWEALEVLRPRPNCTLPTCPSCQGLPSFTPGCPSCANAVLTRAWVFHHPACGYAGLADAPPRGRFVFCPHCGDEGLTAGKDCRWLEAFRCPTCDWVGTDWEMFGHCLSCGLRFPADRAVEVAVPGYDVARFVPTMPERVAVAVDETEERAKR